MSGCCCPLRKIRTTNDDDDDDDSDDDESDEDESDKDDILVINNSKLSCAVTASFVHDSIGRRRSSAHQIAGDRSLLITLL